MTPVFDALVTRLHRFLMRHTAATLAVSIAVALAAAPYATGLFAHIKTDFAALLPPGNPTVKMVEQTAERFGAIKNLIIVFSTTHKEAIPALFAELETRVRTLPGVRRTRYLKPGYDFLRANKLLYLPVADLETLRDGLKDEIDRRKLGALYLDFEDEGEPVSYERFAKHGAFIAGGNFASPYLTNADESVFLFEVYPEPETAVNVTSCEKFFNTVDALVRDIHPKKLAPDMAVSYSGGVKGVVDEYEAVLRDIKRAGFISWALIAILVLQYFRSLRVTGAVFLPLVSGMTATFAIAHAVYGQLNLITAFIFSVLAGVGIENGIHMSTRYFEERRNGMTPENAAFAMLSSTGRAAFMAALTTAGTMAVMIPSGFRGFAEFGGIMAIGIIVIFVSYVLMLPPALVVMDRRGFLSGHEGSARHFIDPLFFMKEWTRPRFVPAILITGILFTAYSVIAAKHARFDDNFAALKAMTKEAAATRRTTDAIYRASSLPALVLTHDAAEALAVKNALLASQKYDATPTVEKIVTLADFVPAGQSLKLPLVAEISRYLDDDALNAVDPKSAGGVRLKELRESIAPGEFTIQDVPDDLKGVFYGKEKIGDEQFVFVSPKLELNLENGADALAFADDTRVIEYGGKTFYAVSHNLIFADLMVQIFKDMQLVLGLGLVAAFLVLWADFRNPATALFVLMPLVLGLIWMFGCMAPLALSLNLFNIVVFSCLIGMSIDNATHIFYRVRETGVENLVPVLRHTGNSVIMSVITAVSGFAGLAAAAHPGLRSTGVLAIIGLATTLMSGLAFFPALLEALHRRNIRV